MEATLDLVGTPLAVILTVMVLLYAFGDNPFFRGLPYPGGVEHSRKHARTFAH